MSGVCGDWSWCCNLQAAALAGILCQLQMEVWALKSEEKALGSLLQQVRRCQSSQSSAHLHLCWGNQKVKGGQGKASWVPLAGQKQCCSVRKEPGTVRSVAALCCRWRTCS